MSVKRLTYTLIATNNGPSLATGVILTDALLASMQFVFTTPPCTQLSGLVTCNLGTLNNGNSATLRIVVTPTTTDTLTNTAGVAG